MLIITGPRSNVSFLAKITFSASWQIDSWRVFRRRNEHYEHACVRQVNRWDGPRVMVWAGVSANHRTTLPFIDGNLTAVRYRDEIMQPAVFPILHDIGPAAVFQQDNARPHVARVCLQFMQENEVTVLDWPAMSPDLNPIEHPGGNVELPWVVRF